MPSTAPIYRGQLTQFETTRSPRWVFSAAESSCVRTYRGPYATLFAGRPSPGDIFEDMPDTVPVDRVDIENDKGIAVMIVTFKTLPGVGGDLTITTTPPQYKVFWETLERTVDSFPSYDDLEQTDRDLIEDYLRSNDASARATILAQLHALPDPRGLPTDLAVNLLSQKAINQTHYLRGYPVIEETTFHITRPQVEKCFVVDSAAPHAAANAPTHDQDGEEFDWLRVADEVEPQGQIFKRFRRWEGAAEWDAFFYDSV